jgi:hypothetical protein
MDPMTWAFLGSSAVPFLTDFLTGSSKKLKNAQNEQQSGIQSILDRIKGDMGTSASDSVMFKAGENKLQKQSKHAVDLLNNQVAAGGLTDEAKLGGLAGINEGGANATVNLLEQADQQRKALQDQYDNLLLKKLGFNVDLAGQQMQGVQGLSSNLASILPFLFRKQQQPVGTTDNILPTGTNYQKNPWGNVG